LIEAAPPIPESIATMQRIRRAVDQPRPTGANLLFRVPTFALAGGLVLFGASAFAAVRMWVENQAAANMVPAPPPRDKPALEPGQQLWAAGQPAVAREQPENAASLPLSAADQPGRTRVQATGRATRQLSAAGDGRRTRSQSALAQKQKSNRNARRHSATRRAGSRGTTSALSAVAASRVAVPSLSSEASSLAASPLVPSEGSSRTAAPLAAETPARVSATTETTDELPAIPEPARLSRAAKRSSDSELVVRAVQMLRRDHDPALASRLLERYRARNPSGVLAEEVLSLRIEAAVAASDPRAPAFAREYLARYPDGRYRERAQRALGGGAP
jgi:hypothetical protein